MWPINVAVPVDFSRVAPGDFLYLMHRPRAVDEWIPVTGARLDAARGVLVADVYSDGLFMPIRAKSDVADPRELARMTAEVPDILRGRSDFEHPFVRLLQGDTDAIADVDTVLLSQYLEAIADGLNNMRLASGARRTHRRNHRAGGALQTAHPERGRESPRTR